MSKAALFDTSGSVKPPQAKVSTLVATGTKPKPLFMNMGISAANKEAKKKEALELCAKGKEYLATSLFKWSADHLGASTKFEAASNAFKVAGDEEQACAMLEMAAKSHSAYGSHSAAANALVNASKLASGDKAIQLNLNAADMYGVCGDLANAANSYACAADLSVESDANAAEELYFKARDMLCHPDTPDSQLSSIKITALETLRRILKFLIKDTSRLEQALDHCHLMARIYKAFEQNSSVHKTLAAMTVIQVHMRDLVAAEQTFLDSLGNSGYAHSKECEIAENFLNAAKSMDAVAMTSIQKSEEIQYLDRDVQQLASQFKLGSGRTSSATAKVQSTVSVSSASKVIKVVNMQEIKVEVSEEGLAKVSGGEETVIEEIELPEEEVEDGDIDEDDLDLL
jgi:hypothetical protein